MTVYEWLVRKSWRVNQRVLKWTLVVLAVVAVPCLFLFTVYAAWTGTPGTLGMNPWVVTAFGWLFCVPYVVWASTRRNAASSAKDVEVTSDDSQGDGGASPVTPQQVTRDGL